MSTELIDVNNPPNTNMTNDLDGLVSGWEVPASESNYDRPPENNRFWMKAGEEKKLLFLTATPYRFVEHNVPIEGKYNRVYATCLGKPNCPLCTFADKDPEGKARAYKVWVFTVIDFTQWTDKKNVIHKNEKKLYICKSKTFEQLVFRHNKLVQKGLTLRGAVIEIHRSQEKLAASVGSNFEYVDHIPESDTNYDFSELDYSCLKPNPAKVAQIMEKLKLESSTLGATLPNSSVTY